jgi:hypothetical protein
MHHNSYELNDMQEIPIMNTVFYTQISSHIIHTTEDHELVESHVEITVTNQKASVTYNEMTSYVIFGA